MCGISGVIGIDTVEPLKNMVQAMHHRGPDDEGYWEEGNVHLGMARLAIIDLSAAGHQPMISSCGRYVIVFNGEVYNFKEERKKLQDEGYVFHSGTDTEVVLNLYKKHKSDCVYHMRGMFAFAVWDREEKQLFIARDHLGIKPVLYHYNNGVFTFGSEIKGMLASGFIKRKLSKAGLSLFFQKGFVPPPYTIIEDVYSLNPGHTLTYRPGSEPVIQQYWDIAPTNNKVTDYKQAVAEVKNLVLNSVNEELISDVPLGVFLSGGLDSSVIVAAMKECGKTSIETFSIGFEGDKHDETEDAACSAKYFNTHHHKITIGEKEVADDFDHYVYGLDQPSVDGLNSYFVSKASSKNVTVALSGLGGDELFGGYSWQHKYYKVNPVSNLIGEALLPFEEVLATMGKIGRKLTNRFVTPSSVINYYRALHPVYSAEKVEEMLVKQVGLTKKEHLAIVEETVKQYPVEKRYTRLQDISKMDLRFFMAGRLLRDGDAVAMINSLEVRFPLVDHRLVTYVWNLPDEFKVQHNLNTVELKKGFERIITYERGNVKQLLFDAFKDQLPPDLYKRSKRGFKMPFDKWARGILADRLQEDIQALGGAILTKQAADDIYTAWMQGKLYWQTTWSLMVLRSWMEQNNVSA